MLIKKVREEFLSGRPYVLLPEEVENKKSSPEKSDELLNIFLNKLLEALNLTYLSPMC